MEKDIGKITKNAQTDIVVRIDDFAGKPGITIREFTSSERYTGFTKSGTKIPIDNLNEFIEMLKSVSEEDIKAVKESAAQEAGQSSSANNATGISSQSALPEEESKEDY